MTTPDRPTFARSMGVFWLYTLLRFAIFFVIFGVLWLVGVGAFLAAVISLVLSIPLSFVLLAKQRRALATTIEQRVNQHQARSRDLDAKLNGTDDD